MLLSKNLQLATSVNDGTEFNMHEVDLRDLPFCIQIDNERILQRLGMRIILSNLFTH